MRHFVHVGNCLINLDNICYARHQFWGGLKVRFVNGGLLELKGEDAEKLLNILERDCVVVVNVSKPREIKLQDPMTWYGPGDSDGHDS